MKFGNNTINRISGLGNGPSKKPHIRLPLAGTVLLVLAIGLLAAMTLTGSNGNGRTYNHPTIALVNEDTGGKFNNATYDFGEQFAHVVQDDSTYQWQMVSRNVADKAFADGSIQGVVYLPQSFSHDILTLQDLNPTKSRVDYKVSADQSVSSRNTVQSKLNNTLRDFNTRVVRMYYASVAGSVADAQTNMTTVVNDQHALTDTMKNDISTPLSTTVKAYQGASIQTTGLRDMNRSWINQQNGFTQATAQTLQSSASTMSAELPQVTSFFDTWNASQALLNSTNLSNANAALSQQHSADGEFYDNAFNASTQNLLAGNQQWSGFSNDNDPNSLTSITNAYNTAIHTTTERLQQQSCTLESSDGCANTTDSGMIPNLRALEQQILHEYFYPETPANQLPLINSQSELDDLANARQSDSTTPSQTNQKARSALAAKLTHSLNTHDNTVNTTYVNNLEQSVCSTLGSSDDATVRQQAHELFTGLNGSSLSQDKIDRYNDELSLLLRYRSSQRICADSPATDLPKLIPATTNNTGEARQISKHVDVTVPANSTTTITVDNPSSTVILVTGPQSLADLGCSMTCDNLQFTPANAQASTQTALTIVNTGESNTGNTPNQISANGSDTLKLSFNYTITVPADAPQSVLTFTQNNRTPTTQQQPMQSYVIIEPTTAAKETNVWDSSNFAPVTQLLSNLDTATSLTRVRFAAPGDTTTDFTSTPSQACTTGGTLNQFNDHSCKSIYNLYNTVDGSSLSTQLSQQDVDSYQQLGASTLSSIFTTLNQATQAQDTLRNAVTTLNTTISDTDGTQSKLDDWYQKALQYISDSDSAWKQQQSAQNVASSQIWNNQQPGKAEIYYDDTNTSDLYNTISQLIDSSSQSASQTAANAQLITDNSADFDSLVKTINDTTTATSTIQTTTNKTLDQATKSLNQTTDYSNNFSRILANTRNPATDKNAIYDFLTNPLAINNQSSGQHDSWLSIDWRWPLILVIGMLIGALGLWSINALKRNKQDRRR
ncbi:MAG: type VII secretion protein EsaA [Bifidobacterium crudilactis]|nr:type VII secretion protein EsaA [Bifidobacterium crudilactis]